MWSMWSTTTVLVTRWVGPRTVADLERPLSPQRAAGLCVAVAATVARLHQAGVVHGCIEGSHVLVDPEGRPVLCGFGSAGAIGDTRRPADDVAGLGRLLTELLAVDDGSGDTSGPAPRRADRNQRRALLTVAAQACTDEPSNRPSVAAFVHGIRRAVPEAHLEPPGSRHPGRSTPRRGGDHPGDRPASRVEHPDTHGSTRRTVPDDPGARPMSGSASPR